MFCEHVWKLQGYDSDFITALFRLRRLYNMPSPPKDVNIASFNHTEIPYH